MNEPTFNERIVAHLATTWTSNPAINGAANGNGPALPASYHGGCEPGALWPVREPAPPPPPDLHDYRKAWIGLAMLLATALLAFGAGWLVRAVQP